MRGPIKFIKGEVNDFREKLSRLQLPWETGGKIEGVNDKTISTFFPANSPLTTKPSRSDSGMNVEIGRCVVRVGIFSRDNAAEIDHKTQTVHL